jgi:hypothetical protein
MRIKITVLWVVTPCSVIYIFTSVFREKCRLHHFQCDLMETVFDGIDWNHVAQNRNQWRHLENKVMDFQVP